MQNPTNGELIGRIKAKLNRVNTDNRLITNKLVYSLLDKWRSLFVSRQDARNRISNTSYLFQMLPPMDLIEVDKVISKCAAIQSGCVIKRTKDKIPNIINGYEGPILRFTSSLDGSEEIQPIKRSAYIKVANSRFFKFNNTKYYWYEDDYLWFPNIEWDQVEIEGYFEFDVNDDCPDCDGELVMPCKSYLDHQFRLPSAVISDMEQYIDQELRNMLGIPTDESLNKNSNQ